MGYGVIGSPADSGSACLGSSPGTPAIYLMFYRTAPSSSGLGLWLLKPATGVRIPSELLTYYFLVSSHLILQQLQQLLQREACLADDLIFPLAH